MAYDFYADNYAITENMTIDSGVLFDVESISVENSVSVFNQGEIYGDIFICDMCTLMLQNSGLIDGRVVLGDKAELVWVVESDNDTVDVSLVDEYSVRIRNNKNVIGESEIFDMAQDAKTVVLENANVRIESGNLIKNLNLEYQGVTTVWIENAEMYAGSAILTNLDLDDSVVILVDRPDPMYAVSADISDGQLFIETRRETEYTKVFANRIELGKFLDLVRRDKNNDSFFAKIDSVKTMPELQNVLKDSVLSRPMNLMDMVQNIDMHEMNNWSHNINSVGGEIVWSDLGVFYGARLDGVIEKDNIKIFGNLFSGDLFATDSMTEYEGWISGGSLGLMFTDDKYLVRGKAGLTIAKFDLDAVFDGNKSVRNPVGNNLWAVTDFGRVYQVKSVMYFMPTVGVGANRIDILNDSRFNLMGRIGAEYGVVWNGVMVDYDLSVGGNIDSFGNLVGNIKLGFMSKMDRAGGELTLGIVDNENGPSYQISVGARFVF